MRLAMERERSYGDLRLQPTVFGKLREEAIDTTNFARTPKLAFSFDMAEYEGEPERIWDEYQWERFLQQQDGKTEKYMQLLETYLDDPDRDEIIAREMGWTQLLDEKDWSAEVDALLDETATEEEEPGVDNTAASGETFQEHNLYRAAFDLTH